MTTSTLYLEHFQLAKHPFDQEPNTNLFFPAAGRKTVLRNLLDDIDSGRSVIKVTGSEGTGKTLLCRLLEQSLNYERYHLVSLEYPVGSYENLLRTICIALGTIEEESDDEEVAGPDYIELFQEYLQQFASDGRNLVLLVDEAENLFLATLERLLRLICDNDIRNLQIVLIGRPDLEAHLDQLVIYCSNVEMGDGYTLEAMSPEETRHYIHFRLNEAGIPGDKYLEAFSEDAIEAIFQAAMGNISLTNSLAELGLKKACEQGKFQVDDELILSQQTAEENVSEVVFQGFDFVKDNKWWLLLGTLFVWILLMLMWPANDKQVQQESYADPDEQLEIITPAQEITIPPVPDRPVIVERKEVLQEQEPEILEPEITTTDERKPLTAKREVGISTEVDSVIDVQPLQEKETVQEQKELIIKADKKKKIVLSQPLEEEHEEVPILAESPPVHEKISSSPDVRIPVRNADALFNERLGATSTWLSREFKGKYTIQLMVLGSENASENLKKILVDDRYYKYKSQLYILRKRYPNTLYLFFGYYPSMDKARKSRNSMPKFLRDNQPYVLSIKDAMEKTKE